MLIENTSTMLCMILNIRRGIRFASFWNINIFHALMMAAFNSAINVYSNPIHFRGGNTDMGIQNRLFHDLHQIIHKKKSRTIFQRLWESCLSEKSILSHKFTLQMAVNEFQAFLEIGSLRVFSGTNKAKFIFIAKAYQHH